MQRLYDAGELAQRVMVINACVIARAENDKEHGDAERTGEQGSDARREFGRRDQEGVGAGVGQARTGV